MELLPIIARLLLYAGVLVGTGVPFARWCRGHAWTARADAPAMRTLLIAWLAVIVSLAVMLSAQLSALELAMSRADLLLLVQQTAWGRGWRTMALLSLAATVLTIVRAPQMLLLAVALAFGASMGGIGHAAADAELPTLSRVLDAMHVWSVSLWIGGLLWLRGDVGVSAWQRFSRAATICAPVALLTGAGSALRRAGAASIPVIQASDYGRLLLLKVLIVGVVLLIGAGHRRAVTKQGAPTAKSVNEELLLALFALAVTAVLTGTAPPGE